MLRASCLGVLSTARDPTRDRAPAPVHAPFPPAAPAHCEPLLAIEPEQLLVVDLYAFPPQQQVQTPIADCWCRADPAGSERRMGPRRIVVDYPSRGQLAA